MLYDEKSTVSRLVLWSTVYHIWFQRNASIHQGRLPSEEAMLRPTGFLALFIVWVSSWRSFGFSLKCIGWVSFDRLGFSFIFIVWVLSLRLIGFSLKHIGWISFGRLGFSLILIVWVSSLRLFRQKPESEDRQKPESEDVEEYNEVSVEDGWRRGLSAANIKFTHSLFWVQIWGLPFELMSEEVGRELGNSIGRFIVMNR
nr:hypothetical protein CFP56_29800 [Quercus suber]